MCSYLFPSGDQFKEETEETMGRQHKRVDWPRMEYHTTENREPKLVVKSTVVPQRSARLRDR